MLSLYLEAPFAACRTFTAGWYRPTATFLAPSAAYGLLLNVAGIETRLREEDEQHDGKTPATYMRPGLPGCKIALGVPTWSETDEAFPRLQTVYQQLHNYPVGASGKARAEDAKGNKYNITPVRREFLSDLRAVIALDGNADLEDAVRRGLCGDFSSTRYGIPFLGDNAFLLDRLEEISSDNSRCAAVLWYERLGPATTSVRKRTTRLTVAIDRADLSKTETALFAPMETPLAISEEVPNSAWIEIKQTTQTLPAPPRSRH